MYCQKCGKENKEGVNYCVNCGAKISAASNSKTQLSPSSPVSKISLEEGEVKKLKKKISNAGTSAVALGWFSIFIAPPLLLLLAMVDGYSDQALFYWFFDLIFAVGVGWVFVKYGKKFNKTVNAESDKAMKVLLWLSLILVVGLPLLGSRPGVLVIILVFYLFSARKALKKFIAAGMLQGELALKD